jgi:hypothetical protein
LAGFDFEFHYTPDHEPLVLVCLKASRARARTLGLSWRWRRTGVHRYQVTIDGNSRRTDLLGYRLERDLPLVCEGCPIVGMSPTPCADLGRGFADLMLRGRDTTPDDVMVLRAVKEASSYFSPFEYECPATTRLHARLSITQELLVSWCFEEVAAEVVLEELHTACELVLEQLVNNRSKKLSFAELVAAADSAGFLSSVPLNPAPASLLLGLKDLRKDVRHRAAQGAAVWLDRHWEDVALCLERLVTLVNRRGDAGDAGHQLDELREETSTSDFWSEDDAGPCSRSPALSESEPLAESARDFAARLDPTPGGPGSAVPPAASPSGDRELERRGFGDVRALDLPERVGVQLPMAFRGPLRPRRVLRWRATSRRPH